VKENVYVSLPYCLNACLVVLFLLLPGKHNKTNYLVCKKILQAHSRIKHVENSSISLSWTLFFCRMKVLSQNNFKLGNARAANDLTPLQAENVPAK
jgi:hypothetical protein